MWDVARWVLAEPETYMKFLKNHSDFDKVHEGSLRRVVIWKSRMMSIKQVKAGEFVDYGTVYQISRKEKITTVPIGYSRGLKRNLTNVGIVLVNGK